MDEEGKIPEVISSSELNTWIFNEDTIRQALNILMTEGIKIEYGQKLGKTIILRRIIIMQKRYWKYLIKSIHIFQIMHE